MSDTPNVPTVVDDTYDALLTDLRAIIASGRERAAAAVNAEIVATYWATASASSGSSACPSATTIIMSISSSTTASCGRRSRSI